MNSIKNLFVVIMLMGVSYGAYQVISTPGAGEQFGEPMEDIFPAPPSTKSPLIAEASEDSRNAAIPDFASEPPFAELEVPKVPMPSSEPPPIRPKADPFALQNPPLAPSQGAALAANSNNETIAPPQLTPPQLTPPQITPPQIAEPQIPLSTNGAENSLAAQPMPANRGGTFQPKPDSELSPVMPKDVATTPLTGNTAPPAPATVSINWEGLQEMVTNGDIRNALKTLSPYYEADLTQAQKIQMLAWLDQLAGKVIYSTEHLLSPNAYVVQANDTLESIAQKWNVTPQLIFNVNSSKIGTPSNLLPGTELKIIEGPFNAVINLERQELTLFLQGMYAGRFNIEIGQDGQGIDHGSFIVEQKALGKNYSVNGQSIAAATPENPYGKYWIGLNSNVSIHESNPLPGQVDTRGSIRLATKDAADVFGILSNGSQVTIKR